MGFLIIIAVAILVVSIANLFVVFNIEKWLAVLCEIEPTPTKEEACVTDPYTKPKEIYSSTPHVVVPKTATEIRNQNFNKLKEGVEYGDIVKR